MAKNVSRSGVPSFRSADENRSAKLPARRIEAERIVLGGLMSFEEDPTDVAKVLTPGDFSVFSHQQLYELICRRSREGDCIEPMCLAEALAGEPILDDLGGLEYLTELTDSVPFPVNLWSFADIVRSGE